MDWTPPERTVAPMTEFEDRLEKYEAELARLRTENDQLRRSAQAFGELAERLNRALLIATAARHAQASFGNLPVHRRLQSAAKD